MLKNVKKKRNKDGRMEKKKNYKAYWVLCDIKSNYTEKNIICEEKCKEE